MENEITKKATEIYTKLSVFDYSEYSKGEVNKERTLYHCNYMLDTIIDLYGDKNYGEVAFWIAVKKFLNNTDTF